MSERVKFLVELLGAVAGSAFRMADNTEDAGEEGLTVWRPDYERLSEALDACDALPELPGMVVRDGWLRALDELRGILDGKGVEPLNTEDFASFAAQSLLDSRGAKNYVTDTYTIDSVDLGKFEVTVRVQKVGAIVPEERVEDLTKALEQSLLCIKRIYKVGYERIVSTGGDCDTPDYMMDSDPTVREIRELLAQAPESCKTPSGSECPGDGVGLCGKRPGYQKDEPVSCHHRGEPCQCVPGK